jgi:hypothetical protein
LESKSADIEIKDKAGELNKPVPPVAHAGKGPAVEGLQQARGRIMRFSRFLSVLCISAIFFAASGCGSGSGGAGGGSDQKAVNTPVPLPAKVNSYSLTQDTLGLKSANFMAAINENGAFTMRVAIADSVTDPNFADIFRIDILKPDQISASGTYSVGVSGNSSISPCDISFFNGEKSTLLNTVAGTVSFTSYGTNTGDLVSGTFVVQVENDGALMDPKPVYTINGSFSFLLNMPGAIP